MAPDEPGARTAGSTDRQGSVGDRRERAPADSGTSRRWRTYLTPVLDFLLVFTTMVALAALTASFLIL